MNSEGQTESVLSKLSPEQKALLGLLADSDVKGNALAGTFLLLKDRQELMEEMILYIWDNKPTPEQINDLLIEMMERWRKTPFSVWVMPMTLSQEYHPLHYECSHLIAHISLKPF